ncbi:hypothetical protein [Pseudokineococcus sp. 1T1Z-3]
MHQTGRSYTTAVLRAYADGAVRLLHGTSVEAELPDVDLPEVW